VYILNKLYGFSPDAFEQFARALALEVFGTGVTVFGNGPDGGREATFRGKVPYPFPDATHWSGYGIIQAKCKEKTETSRKDQGWALKELKKELDLFVASEKRDPKPEYYIFITNVELSSSSGGGKDKADALIKAYYKKLPLKGHSIWDANQLNTYLDKYGNIRSRFSTFLTPGDVLAEMINEIERRRPNTLHILTSFLERELRSDQASRLDQAGNRAEDQIPLENVFFDLPASKKLSFLPPIEEIDKAGKLPPGVLSELLRDGSRKLDPNTLFEQEAISSGQEEGDNEFSTRYVLLGGPGSGKSTLCQFLVQIHRAVLLTRRQQHLLEPRTRQIIAEIRDKCEKEGLSWPTTPRYPFRVELNRFSKALSSKNEDHVDSLEQYLLKSLSRNHNLTVDDLLEWLQTFPWLLVLDGLDEVPMASNRNILVKAINDFLAEARQVEADLFIVATSRQKGYEGEFNSGRMTFRHILPLSKQRALNYIGYYAEARFGNANPHLARDLIEKLRQSADRKLTAELMATPLQVTFMATVVAAQGDPGEDRWQLFNNYYRTIYDRERQKAVRPYDKVLSKQQSIIDRLHHDIGFWLQYQSEQTGSIDISFPITQFEQIVDDYLSEIGYKGTEKDGLVKLIKEAASKRLVFLTSKIEGELSFDVRSLQEFMASECIMTGDAEIVMLRLQSIASALYWRNVFLFAVGKCFADARYRYLQDRIRVLCVDIANPNNTLAKVTQTGSELALDILQSGIVSQNPKYKNHLTDIALSLINQTYLPDNSQAEPSTTWRLSQIYDDSMSNLFREKIELRLGQVVEDFSRGAWPLVLQLIRKNIGWAEDLARQYWPKTIQSQVKLLNILAREFLDDEWVGSRFDELIPKMLPRDAMSLQYTHSEIITNIRETFDNSVARIQIEDEFMTMDCVLVFPDVAYDLDALKDLSKIKWANPDWLPYKFAFDFLRAPDRQSLSKLLRECVNAGWKPKDLALTHYSRLPWPIAACFDSINGTEELLNLADQVEKGVLGDSADWEAAEKRWVADGINLQEFESLALQKKPFDKSISEIGPPPSFDIYGITHTDYSSRRVKELYALLKKLPSGIHRNLIVWMLFLASASTKKGNLVNSVSPSQLRDSLREEDIKNFIIPAIKCPTSKKIEQWLEFLDWIGRFEDLSWMKIPHPLLEVEKEWFQIWEKAFIDNPKKLGLLRLISFLAQKNDFRTIIPMNMIDPDLFEEPRFKSSALILNLSVNNLNKDDAIRLADIAANQIVLDEVQSSTKLLFNAIELHMGEIEVKRSFLSRLLERIPQGYDSELLRCEGLLRDVLRNQESEIRVYDRLHKLQLPIILTK